MEWGKGGKQGHSTKSKVRSGEREESQLKKIQSEGTCAEEDFYILIISYWNQLRI